MSKKSFKFSPKACHKCEQRKRERERERSPPPKHCPIVSVLNLPCRHTLFCLQTLATLNLPCLLCRAVEFCHAVPFRCQTRYATPCCALLNLARPATLHCAPKARLATPHCTLNFRPKHHALCLVQQVFAVEF